MPGLACRTLTQAQAAAVAELTAMPQGGSDVVSERRGRVMDERSYALLAPGRWANDNFIRAYLDVCQVCRILFAGDQLYYRIRCAVIICINIKESEGGYLRAGCRRRRGLGLATAT
jgi:hypothetical protein